MAKFKVKNQEATDKFKMSEFLLQNNALSNNTTDSPSKSRDTVPLIKGQHKVVHEEQIPYTRQIRLILMSYFKAR